MAEGGGSADLPEAISQNLSYARMVCRRQTRLSGLQGGHGRAGEQVGSKNVSFGQEVHGHVPDLKSLVSKTQGNSVYK